MTDDNVWRTVKDHGAPDPDEHEWVLCVPADQADVPGAWTPVYNDPTKAFPSDIVWVPWSPPSAPVPPPPRWTARWVPRAGEWCVRRGSASFWTTDEGNARWLAELCAADRPDTGDGPMTKADLHSTPNEAQREVLRRLAAPPADGVEVDGTRYKVSKYLRQWRGGEDEGWYTSHYPEIGPESLTHLAKVAAALGLVDTGGFDVAGLRAWAQDYTGVCDLTDEFERGERAAYRNVVRKIDSGAFGAAPDPPMRPMDDLPDENRDVVLLQHSDGQRHRAIYTKRSTDHQNGRVGWWPLDDAPAVPTVEGES